MDFNQNEKVFHMKKLLFIIPALLLFVFSSCSNQDIEFEDFDYQTVYFAYQYPVRTITLGEDFVDTSLDNEYKFNLMATLGGVYSNKRDVTIRIEVDNSLVSGFFFSEGDEILPLPQNYYQLASNEIVIPQGKVAGGVQVQLTEDFFNDPLAVNRNYVLPVKMIEVQDADSILSGIPNQFVANPLRLNPNHWEVQPKDYVLYALKFVNPYHGYYLRRGEDDIKGKNGNTDLDSVHVRRAEFVENDEVMLLSTSSLDVLDMPVVLQDAGGNNVDVAIRLTFDSNGDCLVSSSSEDYQVSGSGKFIKDGEKNSFGNQDRDALYLAYEIDLDMMHVATVDTLVLRNRGVGMETFSVAVVEE